ncbi:MAG: ribosome maturation factor RimM [Myxococcota bacterium]|jgi:16S rRNA processing protein RimM|nr:ribosome maturation factor RimM [Myxococcota bacterium]
MSLETSELVILGRLARAHGINGELRVALVDPQSQTLAHVDSLLIETSAQQWTSFVLRRARRALPFWLIHLQGVVSRTQAEALTGRSCAVLRAQLPALDADEFYVHDLIGREVVDRLDRQLGTVVDVFDGGAHDVLVYRRIEDGRTAMVPFVTPFLLEISSAWVRIEALEGIYD